jgi:hypothetical protein
MDRPCAYCKELGHHIRFCGLLQGKAKRQDTTMYVVPNPTPVSKVVITTASNRFASMYSSSSDDEVEDGEIVEETRVRPEQFAEMSDSEEEENDSHNKWTRSNIKVVVRPTVVKQKSDETLGYTYTYEDMMEFMECFADLKQKFAGRSWADIEYDSDFE